MERAELRGSSRTTSRRSFTRRSPMSVDRSASARVIGSRSVAFRARSRSATGSLAMASPSSTPITASRSTRSTSRGRQQPPCDSASSWSPSNGRNDERYRRPAPRRSPSRRDPCRSFRAATTPYVVCLLEHDVTDGRAGRDGQPLVVSRRAQYVRIHPDGTITAAARVPIPNFDAATDDERSSSREILSEPWAQAADLDPALSVKRQ